MLRLSLLGAGLLGLVLSAAPARGQESSDSPPQNGTESDASDGSAKRELPLDQKPYRVKLWLTFDADPMLNERTCAAVVVETQLRIQRSLGGMWQLDCEQDASRVRPARSTGLQRLEPDGLRREFPEQAWDKVLFITVHHVGGAYRLAGREWDTRGRDLSDTRSGMTRERRELSEAIYRLAVALFRPILEVTDVDRDEILLRLQAGEYPAPDPDAAQVRPTDIIRPFVRYRDKELVVQRIQFLPSTYIVVTEVERGWVRGILVSGLRLSLSGRSRRRIDQLGMRERPLYETTRVRFVLRADPSKKLIGHEVRVYGKVRATEETEAEPLELVTDRDGSIALPVDPQHSLQWIYIQSGEELLARVPFAAGLVATETLELLDDSIRLDVEGEIKMLEGQLIDTFARRSVLMAMALAKAKEADQTGADQLVDQLQNVRGLDYFQEQLTRIRSSGLSRARDAGDRIAESRIRKMCDRLQAIVNRYLGEDAMREFREKLGHEIESAKANAG